MGKYEELDALNAAATQGEWALFGDGSIRKPGGVFSPGEKEPGKFICRPDEWEDAELIVALVSAYRAGDLFDASLRLNHIRSAYHECRSGRITDAEFVGVLAAMVTPPQDAAPQTTLAVRRGWDGEVAPDVQPSAVAAPLENMMVLTHGQCAEALANAVCPRCGRTDSWKRLGD